MLAAAIPPAVIIALVLVLFGIGIVMLRVGTDRTAYWSVAALVMVIIWNGFRVSNSAFGDAFEIVALLAVGVHVAATRTAIRLPPWMFAAAVGFLFSGLTNMVFPPRNAIIYPSYFRYATDAFTLGYGFVVPQRSDVGALFKFEASLILMPLLVIAVATTRERVTQLLDIFCLSAIISAFVGVLNFGGIGFGPTPIQGTRASGLTFHPNYLALSSAIAIPLALRWVGTSPRRTTAGVAGAAVLLGGVYASGSRAGIVGALLAVGLTIAVLPRLRRAAGIALPVIGMVIVLVLGFTKYGHKVLEQVRLAHGSDTSGSDSSRSEAAKLAWRQFRARPLSGVGFSVIADAHSIYLELLAAGGAATFVAFFVYLGGLGAAIRRAVGGVSRDVALVCAIAIVVWLANGVLDNQLADKYLYVVPGLAVALGLAEQRVRYPAPVRAPGERASLAAPGVA